MGFQRSVTKEFGIPPEHLDKPIRPGVLELFGLASHDALICGVVLVEGYSYGGHTWSMIARSGDAEDSLAFENDDPDALFGFVDFTHDGPVQPSDALALTETWIRNSANTLYVPAAVRPLPVGRGTELSTAAGLLLVCATNNRQPLL